MKRPIESDYTSHVAYTRALEEYCNEQDESLKLAQDALASLDGVGTVIEWKNQWEKCHAAIAKIKKVLHD